MPDDPSSHPGFEYGNTVYLCARKEAFARSGDLCQLCGQQPAVEAHHWAVDYPPAHKTTAADLTALCAECHFVATTLRRFTRAGGSRYQFCAVLSEVIARCDLNSTLAGVTPIIMHCGATGLDTRSALSREIAAITAKRGGNRTAVDDKRLWELECRRSLYLDAGGRPTLPEAALRRMIENGARKTKQGSLVREGLMIESVTFRYDVDRYGETVEKLITTTQFVVPVVVTKRILRSRAKFDCPWSVVGVADVDPELVDIGQLTAWLATGGRRVGLGDWRPEKSGHYGRFNVEKVRELADAA